MRKFLLMSAVLLLLFVLFLLSSITHVDELDWEHNYENALLTAQEEKKMVYLFIGADVCIHCDRFKKKTLSNKELIGKMQEDYVLLYMSRDRHDIPDGFEKFGVPMHYFLTAKGKIIAKIQGSRELEGWYDVLDELELMKED